MKMLMRHDGTYLIPSSAESVEAYEKLKEGEYTVEVRKARNPGHHRKGFKLLHLAFENQEKYDTFEHFVTEIKLQCGWYEEHVTLGGKTIYQPKSLSFADMDQTEFEEFYNKALRVLTKYFGYDVEEFA